MKKLFFAVLLLLGFVQTAFAYTWNTQDGTGPFATPTAACTYYIQTVRKEVFLNVQYVSDSQFYCHSTAFPNATFMYTSRFGTNDCATGTAYDAQTGTCKSTAPTCTSGSTSTVSFQSAIVSGYSGSKTYTQQMPPPTTDGTCNGVVTKVLNCTSDAALAPAARPSICTVEMTLNGTVTPPGTPSPVATPTATSTSPEVTPAFNPATGQGCPAGTVTTGVDPSGITTCAGTGTNPPVPTTTDKTNATTTATNADGSTTKTGISTHTNADGSTTTTTTKTTTDAAGNATVTRDVFTGTRGDGKSGTPDPVQTDQDKNDLCKLHPELNVCKNSTVAGACEAVTCTGDAIQCSTLKAAAEMNCARKKADEDLKAAPYKTLGDQLVSGADPLASTLPTKDKAATYTMPSSLDGQGWMGGGSCFSDKTFTVQGQAVTIPFSKACQYLVVLRYALMIMAFLFSFKMLSGVILRD